MAKIDLSYKEKQLPVEYSLIYAHLKFRMLITSGF